jgi:hypothetical protein
MYDPHLIWPSYFAMGQQPASYFVFIFMSPMLACAARLESKIG